MLYQYAYVRDENRVGDTKEGELSSHDDAKTFALLRAKTMYDRGNRGGHVEIREKYPQKGKKPFVFKAPVQE